MKNLVFFTSLLAVVGLVDFLSSGEYCSYSCTSNYDGVFFNIAFFLIIINVVAVTLLFLPQNSTTHWWKFARVSIPVVFVLAALINLKVHHSPAGDMQNIFDLPALFFLYSFFTIGSVWQIWKGFRQK